MSGWSPTERPIDIHLKYGIVVLDKPAGPTSHQVSAWARVILQKEKAGHGGTLYPGVTGVLPLAFDNSLRGLQALNTGTKEYVGIVRFHRDVKKKEVSDVFEEFTGPIYQLPPVRSAVKRRTRTRNIYKLELLQKKGRDALFRVSCESGTYIRTLCSDMGDAIGAGANMAELRRTRVSGMTEKDACTLQALKDAYVFWKEGDETWLREAVKPMEMMFAHLPGIILRDSAVDAICHGAPLAAPGIQTISKDYNLGDLITLYTAKGEAVALANATLPSTKAKKMREGIVANIARVLMDSGTYPPGWKKR